MKSIREHNFPSKQPSETIILKTASTAAAAALARKSRSPDSVRRKLDGQAVTSTRPMGPRNEESQPIPSAGEILRDGSFLELVRSPHDRTRALLLHWADSKSAIARELMFDGVRFAPTRAVRQIQHLPSRPASYSSTKVLFNEAVDFIGKYSGLTAEDTELLAFVGFASFFSDCLSMTPCLLLFGTPVPAVSLLRVLGCICRHSVLSAGSSMRLPAELRPTRLICQSDAGLDKQLAALQFAGFGISGQGGHTISGATVIYAGDTEFKSRFAEVCLQLRVSATGGSFGLQEEEQETGRINKLQDQLLMYRLKNHSIVKASKFDVPEFSPGATREVARTLGRCIVGAPDLQARLATLLRSRDDAERTENSSKPEAVVLEALVVLCHERKASVHVGEVATLANAILTRGGESVELSAKQTGGRLKGLGFRTARLDSAGRGIYLLSGQCARIHELGRAFDIPALRNGLPGCPYCKQS